MSYRTMGDAVYEHAKEAAHGGSTSDGVRFLELPDNGDFNPAGNIYLAALSIIRQQKAELAALRAPSATEAAVPAWLSVLPEILDEASAIIAGDKPVRYPIVDELHGFAAQYRTLLAATSPPDPTLALLIEAREHVCYTSHAPGWKNISASLIARIDAHLKERGE